MAEARLGHTVTLLPDGRVLVTGGLDVDRNPLASAELYNPGTNSWSSAGNMVEARYSPTETLLPSGKVLVAGGQHLDSITASAEIYNTVTVSQTGTLTGTVTDKGSDHQGCHGDHPRDRPVGQGRFKRQLHDH